MASPGVTDQEAHNMTIRNALGVAKWHPKAAITDIELRVPRQYRSPHTVVHCETTLLSLRHVHRRLQPCCRKQAILKAPLSHQMQPRDRLSCTGCSYFAHQPSLN
ncbi:hypothetical protein PILCRDRAFT_511772 [Piloderma croceum F 1598]|uniref:Uncharacterized protein n=1 Tax=Piloderma croceum (strain F 1598) TaxID=765440 RepID=A0A0C3B4C1_PILCF|nr:hypothetical protein PILCRDRAFT_511772 [Piloderma croceum F 1598]